MTSSHVTPSPFETLCGGRRGVTLPELLVAMGLIGLLISLSLPALQSARSAAHLTQCQNHLRQLGIASQSYAETYGAFPSTSTYYTEKASGVSEQRFSHSPHGQLLPFLDPAQTDRLDLADATAPLWDVQAPTHRASARNQELHKVSIPVFLCPMDSAPSGATNYRANLGISFRLFQSSDPTAGHGAFVNGRAVRTGEFSDGLSSTTLYSERLVGDGDPASYTAYRDVFAISQYPRTTAAMLRACAGEASLTPASEYSFPGYSWIHGGWLHTWYLHASTPNSLIPDCGLGPRSVDGGGGIYTARSLHTNGVNVVMADGAVHFVGNGIDAGIWSALGTRDGGETTGTDWVR